MPNEPKNISQGNLLQANEKQVASNCLKQQPQLTASQLLVTSASQ